jgi:hypothetical protein
MDSLSGSDLMFADPDNGVADDADSRKVRAKYGKKYRFAKLWTFPVGGVESSSRSPNR